MKLIPHDSNLGWTPWAWTVYIVPFVLSPLYLERYANPGGWLFFGGLTALFLTMYFRSFWACGLELYLLAAAMVVMGISLWPMTHAAGAFFIYGAATLGHIEPTSRAFKIIGLIAGVVVLEAWLIERAWYNAIWPLFFTIMVGALNVHFAQVHRSNARLRLAQDEIAHLAKVAERERIARDLHDLLGHTLSLVILKSELASKLSERDPERAREEIRDVERIAREALAEVRSAVKGYRAGGLHQEIEHARNMLGTAGIAFACEMDAASQLPPAQEAVLCLALREAVTNIVRHSGARQCRMSLQVTEDAVTMRITDDGRGGNEPFGSGLSGMRERMEVLGGTLTRDGRQGTTLTVMLPLTVAAAQERSA
jgi:two-component system, NarL family, sensor histidine kinase DesK